MRKRYLLLMLLLLPLTAMMWSTRAHAQTDAEYTAALAAIGEDGAYYVTTYYADTKYYLTAGGTLTSNPDEGVQFQFTQTGGGGFKSAGYTLDGGTETYFSNPASSGNINDTHLNTHSINGYRTTWEVQVFFMNTEGKFAVRATNAAAPAAGATSGWDWCGSSYWTVKVADAVPYAGYSFDVNYIWVLEDEEGNALEPPADIAKVYAELLAYYNKYEDQVWDTGEGDTMTPLGVGKEFGQYSDTESWTEFWNLLQEINALIESIDPDSYEWLGEGECPTLEEIQAMTAKADELYQKILDSIVPYTMPKDGYYRIFAVKRYKSTYDESGFVDKAIAASFSADHKNKAVYTTLRRDRANFLWKLTKSAEGDSIMIQNAGMGTYISFASDNPENKVIMTEDASDASCLMFDYAGLQYVEPDGEGDERDVFTIRLASRARNDRYFHQMEHSSVSDDSSPWKCYGTDKNKEIELGFWRSTWNYDQQSDTWCSEWFVEYVPDDEAEKLIADFEIVKNHDVLVAQNNELRAKVLDALTTAKDVIRTKMITSADQMTSPYSQNDCGGRDGGDLSAGVLIDGDASTFWHSAYSGTIPEGQHYIQLTGMENMVGDCEFYLRERAGAANDRPKKFQLLGKIVDENSPEEQWVEIATIDIPNFAAGAESTVPFFIDPASTDEETGISYGYESVRVVGTDCDPSNRGFWHAAELQIYTLRDNPNSQFAALDDVAENLDATYNANVATDDAAITLEMYEALLAAYEAFLNAMVDPTELRTAMETYANAAKGVVQGDGPGLWTDTDIAQDYEALQADIAAYDKAGKYDAVQSHKYAVMLKAMQKSIMEKANGVKTDKWYHITFPTEAMYTDYGFDPNSPGGVSKIVDNPDQWGYYVVPGVRTNEMAYDDEAGEEKATGNYYLEYAVTEDVRAGSMSMYFANPDDIEDLDVSMFRFVEKEADEVDYTSLLSETKENMLMALDMSTTYTKGEALITDASQLSTNAPDPSEGLHIEYAVDGNPNTFWHSDYHKEYLEPAYLQVALNEPVSGLIQVDVTRRQGISYGHMVRMYIQGSNDAETWTNIGYLETPYTNLNESVTSQPVDLGGSYKHLRFTLTKRAGKDYEYDPFAVIPSADKYDQNDQEGWTYFHVAEFQIYPVTPNVELNENGQALMQAYTTANKVVLKDASAEDVAAAAAAYRAYRTDFNAAEGKEVLPYGKDKAAPVYAIQNKATGLFINCQGSNNANNTLETIPTLFTYEAIGYQRSLMHGKMVGGYDCTYLHSQNFDHRFVTWNATAPNSNSGLVIVEAEEEYAAPAEFTFYRDIKPGKIYNWCNSVTITPEPVDDAFAYTPLGQYTVGEDEEATVFLAVKEIETIPAGEPAFYIYGDTLAYDSEDDYVEPVKFTIPSGEELVLKAETLNGCIGLLGNHNLKDYEIYFTGNHPVCINETGYRVYAPNWGVVLDLNDCPQVDPDESYDFSICLGKAAEDAADGVKDVSSTIEKISQPGNVYSMDGKLLRTGATLNSLKSLGKGMYILNGVKVLVK